MVVLHGGFWRQHYTLSLGRAISRELAANGWIAWNLEYRRHPNAGGWRATFDDVAAGIDKLAELHAVPTSKVLALGHSAGGLLAVWACARGALNGAWGNPRVPLVAAISQAGVLDLAGAVRDNLGDGAVLEFLGGPLDERRALVDPISQLPVPARIWCVHASFDLDVPFSQSADYVAAARAAGTRAELVTVSGGHFGHLDPRSPAWATTVKLLDNL